ncbi:ribonuclease H-like domain-containing protein [Tanacetum coccineum]
MLFHHKYLSDGTLSHYKARLVVNGSTHVASIDVDETFSPVVKPGTIWTVLSLATSRHWLIHQLDVKNAFLHVQQVCLYMNDPREPHFSALKRILRYVREAEYRGVANAISETCLLRNLLRELHTPLSFATLVYCDNYADIFTKGLPSALFKEFRTSLSICCPPTPTARE